jgi:DNA-binding transcriptional regulator LsrR (DeoR family)
MAVYLVTYDLKKPGQDYSGLLAKIRSYAFARLSESSYAIESLESPEAVCTALRRFMDANDTIYVINLKRPYSGYGPQDTNQWLEQKLPY